MKPPNTTPSSISPLEMATMAPTHSPTHTHKSTTQRKKRRERKSRWIQMDLLTIAILRPAVTLYFSLQKKKDKVHINSSKNILVFQRTGEKLRREV